VSNRKRHHFLQIINAESARLATINNVLDFARLDRGGGATA
jgi:hypothetical protein